LLSHDDLMIVLCFTVLTEQKRRKKGSKKEIRISAGVWEGGPSPHCRTNLDLGGKMAGALADRPGHRDGEGTSGTYSCH
jgi:hypothetical protein